MTPADERIVQLLAKWQKSLELHLRYVKLSDGEYRQKQAWPQHERPKRMVLNLALERLAALQRIAQARISAGDPSLSEALELMAFLSNLVGAENIERFIPLAEESPAADVAQPAAQKAKRTRTAPPKATVEDEVAADAVRLMGWGKAWHELPAAIERMAGRPNASAIRKILKSRRQDLERLAEELAAQK